MSKQDGRVEKTNSYNKKRKVLSFDEFKRNQKQSSDAKHVEKGEADLTKKHYGGEKKGDKGIATLDESLNENKAIKVIEDRENAERKYEFFKTPTGKIEYQIYDWDSVDGDWAKAGSPSSDIDWLFDEENPEIDEFLKSQGYKKK